MEVQIKQSGLCIVHNVPSGVLPCCLRSIRGSNCYYTGWRWLPYLKSIYGNFAIEGKDILRDLYQHSQRVFALKSNGSCTENNLSDILKIKLWDCQTQAITCMAEAKRFYLASDVGLGKTLTAFGTLLVLGDKVKRALVVCTSSVKYQWQDEILNALNDEHRNKYSISVVSGNASERKQCYDKDCFLYITNYESLLSDLSNNRVFKKSFDAIIFDEAWKIRNRRTKIHGAIRVFVRDIPYRYALNATPIANRYEELFGVFQILDPLIFISWANFASRYTLFEKIRLKNGRSFPKLVGYRHVSEIRNLIKSSILRKTIDEAVKDRPNVIVTPRWVELTKNQRNEYERIKSSNAGALAKVVKARIACLFDTPLLNSPKLRELVDLLVETFRKEKVLVFSESLVFLGGVLQQLQSLGIPSLLLSGDDSSSDRNLKQGLFTEGKSRVLLCTAAGEAGINLQSADIVVNLDLPWSPDRLQQRVGRLRPHLGGKQRTIRVINILARDTIEERVIEVIHRKIGYFSSFFGEDVIDLTGIFTVNNLVRYL